MAFLSYRPFLQLAHSSEMPTLPDSAEDFLIFRENIPIWVHKFDNLPDSRIFLSIELYVIWKIFLIGEENLPNCRMQMLAALHSRQRARANWNENETELSLSWSQYFVSAARTPLTSTGTRTSLVLLRVRRTLTSLTWMRQLKEWFLAFIFQSSLIFMFQFIWSYRVPKNVIR